MNFGFFLALALAFAVEPLPLRLPVDSSGRLLALILSTGAFLFLTLMVSLAAALRVRYGLPDRPGALWWFYVFRSVHFWLGLLLYWYQLQIIGWTSLLSIHWNWGNWVLAHTLLLLAPYIFVELSSLWCFYLVDRAIRHRLLDLGIPATGFGSWLEYVDFHARFQMGIFLLPLCFIAVSQDLLRWVIPQWDVFIPEEGAALVMMSITGLAVVLAPALMPWLCRAVPMPPSLLRDHFLQLARDLGFRFSNILVWHVHGGMANAMVTGIVPRLRYILLSDALLENLTDAEIEAVFAHELGHLRFRHSLFYMFFLIASTILLAQIEEITRPYVRDFATAPGRIWLSTTLQYVPLPALVFLPYLGFMFGFLSRRFERQADLFGARIASRKSLSKPEPAEPNHALLAGVPPWVIANVPQGSSTAAVPSSKPAALPRDGACWPVTPQGVEVFAQALEKVSFLNGIPRSGYDWLHGSVAQRIENLQRVRHIPALADEYDRFLYAMRWTLVTALVSAIIGLALIA